MAAAAAERATASYYQGLGALALGQVSEAAEAFQRSLEADASGECAEEAREQPGSNSRLHRRSSA